MSVHHLLPATNDAREPGAGLLDALQRWPDTARTATAECHVPERRAMDADRATIERTRGAVMRRYGMGTFQALSLMVRWARQAHTPVHTLARMPVQGIDEADAQPETTPSADPRALMEAGSFPGLGGEIVDESSIIRFEVLVLPPDLASVSEARAFVGATLASHELLYLIDDIRLAVSELVTNALVHGQPPVIMTVEELRFDVVVSVSDESPARPVVPPQNATAVSGRGLSLVELLSSEWGTSTRPDGGKSTWARFNKMTSATRMEPVATGLISS